MIAGASAVAVGCQNLVDPFACQKIIEEMNEILDSMGIDDVNDIIGLSHKY
jgi:Dihydroorotate dehydrogenase